MADHFEGTYILQGLRLKGKIRALYICPNCGNERNVAFEAKELTDGVTVECPLCDRRDFGFEIEVKVSGHHLEYNMDRLGPDTRVEITEREPDVMFYGKHGIVVSWASDWNTKVLCDDGLIWVGNKFNIKKEVPVCLSSMVA